MPLRMDYITFMLEKRRGWIVAAVARIAEEWVLLEVM
jgi:hypothetical protein